MALVAISAPLSRCCWLPLLSFVIIMELTWTARGQGLRPDDEPLARSGSRFASFQQAYRTSTAWRNAIRTSKRTACSRDSGNLCGSASEEDLAALQLATSPQAYDARSKFSSVQVVGPVKDQGSCGMCVAFAVLASAQTAAAVGLRQSLANATLSEQDYFMCRTADDIVERGCSTGWSLKDGMLAFVQLQRRQQLPVVEACRRYAPRSPSPCGPAACSTTLPQLLQGVYRIKQLGSIWEMQRHIRQHGSIVCRMQLYSDIKPFFAANRSGVYNGPGAGARAEDAHAVQVVGYDNNRQAWLIKNSWGPGFAVNGFAWVGFDAPDVCSGRDTYGYVFNPSEPQPADLPLLTPVPGRQGCYTYRAVAGDYPEGLASWVGIPVQRLLLDNLDVIKDPSTLPAGTNLLLCGVGLDGAAGEGSKEAPAAGVDTAPSNNSSNSSDEVAALLAIKRVLDPFETALWDWQPGSASPCNWTGVVCDVGDQRVLYIQFWDGAANRSMVQLSGQLPNATLLRRLPGLARIGLAYTGVGGPLPEDWSQLQQLSEVYLSGNRLRGTLPRSWGVLTKLRVCIMWLNRLSGPLPSAWSGMAALEELHLTANALTGTLPATWSRLAALKDLRLAANSLSGTLPPSWGVLSKLQVLDLSDNTLMGSLPGTWSRLDALQKLALAGNRLTGPLPPSWGDLVELRACNLQFNMLSGPLPGAWSGMAALEELGLSTNGLTGTLPPSWGALSKLRVCILHTNRLRGPLPGAWSGMVALEQLALFANALAGTVPPSWGSWGQVKGVSLRANPQLRGCLPPAWRGKVNVGRVVDMEGPYKGKDPLTAGTNITGFC